MIEVADEKEEWIDWSNLKARFNRAGIEGALKFIQREGLYRGT